MDKPTLHLVPPPPDPDRQDDLAPLLAASIEMVRREKWRERVHAEVEELLKRQSERKR